MATDEQLLERLKHCAGKHTVIVGIGNTLKADDGAGSVICEQLKPLLPVDVIDTSTVPENYIQHIRKKQSRHIIIIDAIDFGGKAGGIEFFTPDQLDSTMLSTHVLSPRSFVEMITQDTDAEVILIGIQPASTEIGRPLSLKVRQAVNCLTSILIKVFGT